MTVPSFEAWLVVREGLLPERWRDRASSALVVPLLASESHHVLRAFASVPADLDDHLARLVAEGSTNPEIAQQLGFSIRSVERRIASLRRRFDVASKGELSQVLSDLGFGGPANSATD